MGSSQLVIDTAPTDAPTKASPEAAARLSLDAATREATVCKRTYRILRSLSDYKLRSTRAKPYSSFSCLFYHQILNGHAELTSNRTESEHKRGSFSTQPKTHRNRSYGRQRHTMAGTRNETRGSTGKHGCRRIIGSVEYGSCIQLPTTMADVLAKRKVERIIVQSKSHANDVPARMT